MGMLSLERGDTAAAGEQRRAIMQLRGDENARQVAAALATSLHGHTLITQGRPDQALEQLLSRASEIRSPPEFLALSPVYSRAHDRFTIAELYRARGDDEQAIRWYRSLLDGFDFPYAAPAHLRLSEILADDDPDRAAWHAARYRRLTSR
jgi:lipopolysaccharide biosynthesis regulator YciM